MLGETLGGIATVPPTPSMIDIKVGAVLLLDAGTHDRPVVTPAIVVEIPRPGISVRVRVWSAYFGQFTTYFAKPRQFVRHATRADITPELFEAALSERVTAGVVS